MINDTFVPKSNTHVVLKEDDINKYLTKAEKDIFSVLYNKVVDERAKDGKKENSYYVINNDEPYSGAILEVIKVGEHVKEKYINKGELPNE